METRTPYRERLGESLEAPSRGYVVFVAFGERLVTGSVAYSSIPASIARS